VEKSAIALCTSWPTEGSPDAADASARYADDELVATGLLLVALLVREIVP
jgi:hypothetical protein